MAAVEPISEEELATVSCTIASRSNGYLLLDTNILLYDVLVLSRNEQRHYGVYRILGNAELYISVVSLAEAKSIILQNGWSDLKLPSGLTLVAGIRVSIVEVTDYLTNTYIQIDSFSQRLKSQWLNQYSFNTAPREVWVRMPNLCYCLATCVSSSTLSWSQLMPILSDRTDWRIHCPPTANDDRYQRSYKAVASANG